ncbi:RNA 2',3'-cyclic phosphodiesterase [Roseiterribacter gracilis]|uniref:RNA 2',3'-cyclic phosphodiesterase n=1 Tax=Roseiterribacter gracilis TaxID=2812848 RepID=A0A8S8XGC3_9PROT|nr:RNA 2',3'-cyclic phosphodiesterase [Rhodospirillales bacterium TMPK1]
MRLFVALELPDDARDALVQLQGGLPGARWVERENLHVTLRFVGAVDALIADDLAAALAAIDAPKVEFAIQGAGRFASRDKARALYAAIAHSPSLDHLHAKVERAAIAAGLDPEPRRFTPHVTLARLYDSPIALVDRAAAELSGLALGPFLLNEFVLLESLLGKERPVYRPVARYPLR